MNTFYGLYLANKYKDAGNIFKNSPKSTCHIMKNMLQDKRLIIDNDLIYTCIYLDMYDLLEYMAQYYSDDFQKIMGKPYTTTEFKERCTTNIIATSSIYAGIVSWRDICIMLHRYMCHHIILLYHYKNEKYLEIDEMTELKNLKMWLQYNRQYYDSPEIMNNRAKEIGMIPNYMKLLTIDLLQNTNFKK